MVSIETDHTRNSSTRGLQVSRLLSRPNRVTSDIDGMATTVVDVADRGLHAAAAAATAGDNEINFIVDSVLCLCNSFQQVL